ncbi:NAD(P)-dependent oxidoreductase [Enterococcus sp. LJL90]
MNKKFQKLVAIEPTRLLPEDESRLKELAVDSIFYDNQPENDNEIISRIGNADGVFVSFSTEISGNVIEHCPNIQYIGMCCSLYAPESANVDILTAEKRGIIVKGVRDYGDEGVREYVMSELIKFLQGRDRPQWKTEVLELTGLKIGIVGMGTLGSLITNTLHFFQAELFYYSRSRKPEIEKELSCTYLPLAELLQEVDVLITCLNKNVCLIGKKEFELFGSGKLFMNVSGSPVHEMSALKDWLKNPNNYGLSDTIEGLGKEVSDFPNVFTGKNMPV